jgi:hypothetical protein
VNEAAGQARLWTLANSGITYSNPALVMYVCRHFREIVFQVILRNDSGMQWADVREMYYCTYVMYSRGLHGPKFQNFARLEKHLAQARSSYSSMLPAPHLSPTSLRSSAVAAGSVYSLHRLSYDQHIRN